jgi:hypothetical protein
MPKQVGAITEPVTVQPQPNRIFRTEVTDAPDLTELEEGRPLSQKTLREQAAGRTAIRSSGLVADLEDEPERKDTP